MVVNEIRHNVYDGSNVEFNFIPSSTFKSLLPTNLITDYSHWLNKNENYIEFRSKLYTDKNEEKVFYKFDLYDCKLYDLVCEQYLVDIQSSTFKEIHNKITKRVELSEFVHMFVKNNQLHVDLPRMGLGFEYDMSRNCVVSRDYRGMKVSECQKLDTLFGLEKGLLLCQDIDRIDIVEKVKKQFIVPNGQIQREKLGSDEHHKIDIIISTCIRTPSYYLYEIDDYLRKLRAEESINSWLYLAWLHASTSHVLPDPFLGITGTEMALELLQSGNCWSVKPLDDEAMFILNNISELSPKREFYLNPRTQIMQKVTWPATLPSMASHEAFQWIVEKIVNDSDRLAFTFPQCVRKLKLNKTSNKALSSRAYNRIIDYYSNMARVSSNFKNIFNAPNPPKLTFDTNYQWSSAEISNARIISSNSHQPSNVEFREFTFQSKSTYRRFTRRFCLFNNNRMVRNVHLN